MDIDRLAQTARSLVAPGKGILAADESTPTITKRFQSIGVESTEETRRTYRELLFTTPDIGDHLSGVILYDETIRQNASDGTPLRNVLAAKGIMPGIKVDKGAKDLAGFPGEKVTEGLDGLRDRLAEYAQIGARFAKWRAVITVGHGIPTPFALEANAHALARYAALCQEQGLVPIVEPEVLMDGDHSIEDCEAATESTLHHVFDQLYRHGVALEGMLLKPNMVLPGKGSSQKPAPEAVAVATVGCFSRVLPSALPGVVFLSGGQTPVEATANLNAMNSLGSQPWELSFSFSRALQGPVMETWKGNAVNARNAQEVFLHRVRCAGLAREGKYTEEAERQAPTFA